MKHCVNGGLFPVLQLCQESIKQPLHTYKVQEGDSCAETIMNYG